MAKTGAEAESEQTPEAAPIAEDVLEQSEHAVAALEE